MAYVCVSGLVAHATPSVALSLPPVPRDNRSARPKPTVIARMNCNCANPDSDSDSDSDPDSDSDSNSNSGNQWWRIV